MMGSTTNDKLAALAKWLNADEHWLHYESPPVKTGEEANGNGRETAPLTAESIQLAQKIQALPPHRRYLVEELLKQLQENL